MYQCVNNIKTGSFKMVNINLIKLCFTFFRNLSNLCIAFRINIFLCILKKIISGAINIILVSNVDFKKIILHLTIYTEHTKKFETLFNFLHIGNKKSKLFVKLFLKR